MQNDVLNRGVTGILPRPANLADESYLDFVQSLRSNFLSRMFPVVAEAGHRRMAAKGQQIDDDDLPLETIKDTFQELPGTRVWKRFMRTQQEMLWRRTRGSFAQRESAHLAAMDAAEGAGPGRLIYDPQFVTPDYARREIHLQPGGYTDDSLSGLVFHYGTKVFYDGANDQDELHGQFADLAVMPEGRVERILDLGCSIGQASVHLKRRFPDADIVGLDVALPLLRYAHMRTAGLGVDVTYVQALAEKTGFPDGHFDAVLAFILFHELPIAVIPEVLAEMHRILRPGGVFTVIEFPNAGQHLPPANRLYIDTDARDNCEPYSRDFVASDFPALIEAAGFSVTRVPSNSFLQNLVCRKAG